MSAADVPCIPGYHGSNQDPSHLQNEAVSIGYPVLLKAVHGGGGKGMRIAYSPDQFLSQLESAKSEAQNSFGDSTMLVEKYITRPRHVEVQVFGDKHGNAVALGERDCSIQRRHQKIIEESPAPGLSMTQRKELWQKAIEAAKAVNYVGAGTVEFILDADTGGFYFMEMNTRLQVEHPVTEMCTGLDLVEWQVRVARGERLPLSQAEVEERIANRGHAVEARIYAEDPDMDFLPTAGTLTHLSLPEEVQDSVRIDTAIKSAPTTISSHYDPMISKLIVRGPDRSTALRKLKTALEEYEVAGLATNIEFLKQLCVNESFIAAGEDLETGFIPKHKGELFPPRDIPPEAWAQAALALFLSESSSNGLFTSNDSSGQSRTLTLSEARTSTPASPTSIDVQQTGPSTFTVNVASDTTDGQIFNNTQTSLSRTSPNTYSLKSYYPHTLLTSTLVVPPPASSTSTYDPLDPSRTITLFHLGTRYDLAIPAPAWLAKALGKSPSSAVGNSVSAPMPSKILRVETKEGDTVQKDVPLVVVESMKMEMVLRAPREGRVKRVVHGPGVSTVHEGLLMGTGLTWDRKFVRQGLCWLSWRRWRKGMMRSRVSLAFLIIRSQM